MAEDNDAIDVRTDSQKIEMAEAFETYEAEYREEDEHRTVVYEDDDCVIIADHTGHEVNEWADDFGVDRSELLSTFRTLADQKMNKSDAHEAFSHSDPVVFDKFEDK